MAPTGVANAGESCTPDPPNLAMETDEHGTNYIFAFAKMVCKRTGSGTVSIILYEDGEAIGRSSGSSLDTDVFTQLTPTCHAVPENVHYFMMATFNDALITHELTASLNTKCLT